MGSSALKNCAERIICLSMGRWPKSSMYFKLTPVCLRIAWRKISFTIDASYPSCSLDALLAASHVARRACLALPIEEGMIKDVLNYLSTL